MTHPLVDDDASISAARWTSTEEKPDVPAKENLHDKSRNQIEELEDSRAFLHIVLLFWRSNSAICCPTFEHAH